MTGIMDDWQGKYVQNVKREAASNRIIIETMKIWDMMQDEYELKLRAFLYSPKYTSSYPNAGFPIVVCKDCQQLTSGQCPKHAIHYVAHRDLYSTDYHIANTANISMFKIDCKPATPSGS